MSSDQRVVGTVSILNRLAQSIGFGANSKVFKPCKGLLQVRNRSDGRQMLVVSTRKDVVAQEYNVSLIQSLRTRHLTDGLATIDISEPPMSILLKDCDPPALTKFIANLQSLRKTGGKKSEEVSAAAAPMVEKNVKGGESSSSSSKRPRSRAPTASQQPEKNVEGTENEVDDEDAGSLMRRRGSFKRPRSPELSKTTQERAKKILLSTNTKITIRKRENYPKEFALTLEQVKMLGIGLRKFDNRMLKLESLTVLDLSGNKLKSANELMKFVCRLKSLTLEGNQIDSLPDDFFNCASLSGLNHLNFSQNKLKKLPPSITNLRELSSAKLNDNELVYLPYNLKTMKSLRTLDLCRNSLTFVPKTLTYLPLGSLDISENPLVNGHEFGDNWMRSENYVGFNDVPTLFERACEVIMNTRRSERTVSSSPEALPLWPSIVDTYLNGGRYCIDCGKLYLRYNIITTCVSTRDLCQGLMSRCLITPASNNCMMKTIMCYKCSLRLDRRRRAR